MKTYVRKQKPIEAIQYSGEPENTKMILVWGRGAIELMDKTRNQTLLRLRPRGSEPAMFVKPGDYVLKTDRGFIPMKAMEFENDYKEQKPLFMLNVDHIPKGMTAEEVLKIWKEDERNPILYQGNGQPIIRSME